MPSVESLQEDEGPGAYEYMSVINVWHGDGRSVALHAAPSGIAKEDRQLGTVTRAVYHTLETAGSVPGDNTFVALHFLPDEMAVDVTMLPVGDERVRGAQDAALKSGPEGFQALITHVVECCRGKGGRLDTVRILYNDPGDFATPSKIAIVQEMDTKVSSVDVAGFLKAMRGTSD